MIKIISIIVFSSKQSSIRKHVERMKMFYNNATEREREGERERENRVGKREKQRDGLTQ